jgi:hypothetical protein
LRAMTTLRTTLRLRRSLNKMLSMPLTLLGHPRFFDSKDVVCVRSTLRYNRRIEQRWQNGNVVSLRYLGSFQDFRRVRKGL